MPPPRNRQRLLSADNGDLMELFKTQHGYQIRWQWFSNGPCHEIENFQTFPKAMNAINRWLNANFADLETNGEPAKISA